jgi:hypothetical protein
MLATLSGSGSASTSNITAYPQGRLNRGTYFLSMFDTTALPYNVQLNGCSNTLCYTTSKSNFIYKPHSAYGMVGRTSAGYLGQRNRL